MRRSAAVSAAVDRGVRPHLRGQDALATTGKLPALRKADLCRPNDARAARAAPISAGLKKNKFI